MMTQQRRGAAARLWQSLAGCVALAALILVTAPSCGGGNNSGANCTVADTDTGCPAGQECVADSGGTYACICSLTANTGCMNGQACEEVPGGQPGCFDPVTVGGKVFDLATNMPVAGARVVGRDANFAALTGVAVTDAAGHYALKVPVPRKADGSLLQEQIFLRADASKYLTFPTAPRVALPIEVSMASGKPPHLESSATDIGMIALESSTGLGTVSGKVIAKLPKGTLVVAGGAASMGGGVTGIADTDGSYTVFNVPAGMVNVSGYKAGLELVPAKANVMAGATVMGVDLKSKGAATATVSGSINVVNPGMGSTTSVILVVDETFDPNAARGEAPPGLRVTGISNAFSIPNVPDGNYVVLAAFENDFLTRDPDTSIGGTALVHITVSGQSQSLSQSFKVTGSLDHPSPDGEEVVMGTPTFTWDDDSSEDHYELRVFDAFGTKVWEDLDVPSVSGNKTVSAMYGGPALKSGSLYQFRAISIKKNVPISMTEDLRGVFLYK